MTIEEIIDRELGTGLQDPHVIYDRLVAHVGEAMLVELLQPHIPEIVSELARQRMSATRRAAVAKISKSNVTTPEVMLKSLWVPSSEPGEIVYKRIADMTAYDFEDRAAYLERMTAAISRHATWCRRVATEMKQQGVETAGELSQLPELPAAA